MERRRVWGILANLTLVAVVLATLLICSVMLALLGPNSLTVYKLLFSEELGSTNTLAHIIIEVALPLFALLGVSCPTFMGYSSGLVETAVTQVGKLASIVGNAEGSSFLRGTFRMSYITGTKRGNIYG